MSNTAPRRGPVRVVVADDSELSRAVLAHVLGSDPEIEVVGLASDGHQAVELVKLLRPNIVTIDLRMPGIDGLAAAAAIMQAQPTPVLIVTSSSFHQRRESVFAAFKYGVLDVVPKPELTSDPGSCPAAQSLIEKVKILSRVDVSGGRQVQPHSAQPTAQPVVAKERIIGIGASTGGPPALRQTLSGLPADFGAPILVVQHMSETFVEGFVEWLAGEVSLDVQVARDGDIPQPRRVLVSPGGKNMVVTARRRVRFNDEPTPAGILPSADLLFSSLAAVYGTGAVGVILTGIGRDGTVGAADIRRAGGRVLAQDERSCVVAGMPGSAVRAGVVDEVVHLSHIADRLKHIIR